MSRHGRTDPPSQRSPLHHPIADTDREPTHVYGQHLLALTDRLNGTESYDRAAELVEEILDPADGALERLADFFEAAGEKAKESDADDGFDLAQGFEEAAVGIRRLNEDLHLAVDRMRALTTPPPEPAPPGRATHSASTTAPTPTMHTVVPRRHR